MSSTSSFSFARSQEEASATTDTAEDAQQRREHARQRVAITIARVMYMPNARMACVCVYVPPIACECAFVGKLADSVFDTMFTNSLPYLRSSKRQ